MTFSRMRIESPAEAPIDPATGKAMLYTLKEDGPNVHVDGPTLLPMEGGKSMERRMGSLNLVIRSPGASRAP